MVPLERGRASHDRLIQLGYDVEWRTYPMGHEVHPREIQDIGAWLRERLTAG
jgi:phospholipase/carboxylesterase